MIKVSVIMASYLGQYPNRASNPEKKFIRAVKSFLSQTYDNKELIIVADGCITTINIYNEMFKSYSNIRLVPMQKRPIYSGDSRNMGLNIADGDIIAYLDNDDVWGKTHLETITSQFSDDVDLVYYDDYLVMSSDFKQLYKRINDLSYGNIGTSSISHRNEKWLRWVDGYGHDWVFIMKAVTNGMRYKKLDKSPQYLVAHWGSGNKKGDY